MSLHQHRKKGVKDDLSWLNWLDYESSDIDLKFSHYKTVTVKWNNGYNYNYLHFLGPGSTTLCSKKRQCAVRCLSRKHIINLLLHSWKGVTCWLDNIHEVMRLLEYCNLITARVN
jgi:hypothetical protein